MADEFGGDPAETKLCVKCQKNPAIETSVLCQACLDERATSAKPPAVDVAILKGHQEVFTRAVDQLIVIYRDFDRSNRATIKDRMKKFYETLQELGGRLGVSRQSLDHLWAG